MSKPNLYSLSAAERRDMSALIREYTTPRIIRMHWDAARAGAHSDGRRFLTFHRTFVGGLENFLRLRRRSQWVPLPTWNPAEPIPAEFNIPNSGLGRLRSLNPQVNFFPRFSGSNLRQFRTEDELGMALMEQHNLVHRRVGGVMNNQRRAPEAPIFWPFHSFIDDIWLEWQAMQ